MAKQMRDVVTDALGEFRYEPMAARLRGVSSNMVVVDSLRTVLVWEPRRVVPSYAVPADDIVGELVPCRDEQVGVEQPVRLGHDGRRVLDPRTPFSVHSASGSALDIRTSDGVLAGAAFRFDAPSLDDLVALDFAAFDGWREEDDEVVGHPRDPFHRIDVRPSSRHVEVMFDGQQVASSDRPHLLFETMLPPRYYLPREDVGLDLLAPSTTHTTCAYKGQASYLSLQGSDAGRDIAWTYPEPLRDATLLTDAIAFFNERVDLVVDGRRVERPVSPWS